MPQGWAAALAVEWAAYVWIRGLLEGEGIAARDLQRADRSNHTGARPGHSLDNPGGGPAPARGGALGLHRHLARDHPQGTARRQALKSYIPSGRTVCA